MPEDITVLSQMIKDTAKVSLRDNYGKKIVELVEPAQPDSQVTIYGLPDNAIVIKADKFRAPDAIFEGTQGECKRCDFLIVADTGSKRVIVFIEMKAEKGPRKEIVQQLKGAKCLIAYCGEIGKEFWNQRHFLDGYEERYVSIGHTRLAKKKTRLTRDVEKHNHPEHFMKIDWPNRLQFSHIAS